MTTMAQTACPRCNGTIAAGAQFCGSCGAQLGAAPPPPPIPQPPPAPQPPPLPQMARGFTGASGGNAKQATFNGTAQDAYNQALNALNVSANGITNQVTWQQAPHAAKFETVCKSFWSTAGFGIKYDGELQVQPAGPGQVTARYTLKVQWGSAMGLIITQGLCAAIAATNPYLFGFALFFILGIMGYTAWNIASNLPEKALQQFMRALQGGAAPTANGFTPQQQPQPATQQHVAPQPVAPAPTPAAPTNDSAVIMEQIKQLGALKDAGILTADEFETKKAELLKRL